MTRMNSRPSGDMASTFIMGPYAGMAPAVPAAAAPESFKK